MVSSASTLFWVSIDIVLLPIRRSPILTLNAVFALTRILGDSSSARSTLLIQRCNQLVMDGPEIEFLSEIPHTAEISRFLINACGEATLMLFQLADDGSCPAESKWNDVQVMVVNLWSNLIRELNQKRRVDDVMLAFQNINQLANELVNVRMFDGAGDAGQKRERVPKLKHVFLLQVEHGENAANLATTIKMLLEIAVRTFIFKTGGVFVSRDEYIPIFTSLYQTLSKIAEMIQDVGVDTILSTALIFNATRNYEEFAALVDAIYVNIINEKSWHLTLSLWTHVVKQMTICMRNKLPEMKQWNLNNRSAMSRTGRNYLAWPLCQTMASIGVSVCFAMQPPLFYWFLLLTIAHISLYCMAGHQFQTGVDRIGYSFE